MEYRIISIGTLAAHPLWGEEHGQVRTGHATTTLVSTNAAQILVDPSLPTAAMLARLGERSPVRADQITDVFLTTAGLDHMRAMGAFPDARWYVGETELAEAKSDLARRHDDARSGNDDQLTEFLHDEMALLGRCKPAPDRLYDGVDLFPLPGVTSGCCGLLLSLPRATVLICGDAIATHEHLMQGKVLPTCHDVELAQESFAEAIEIADLLILGRDNISLNPLRQPHPL